MILDWNRPVLDQNLYYVGLKLTSATFTSATVNILPAVTFIMALVFRLIFTFLPRGYFWSFWSFHIIQLILIINIKKIKN